MGNTRKLISEVHEICIISCVGLVEKAINLADKLINQSDITCVNSTQEVDLHKITCLTALLITKQKAYLVPKKRVDKSVPSESGIEK